MSSLKKIHSLLALLAASALPLFSGDQQAARSDEAKQRQDLERQVHDAELQVREAERALQEAAMRLALLQGESGDRHAGSNQHFLFVYDRPRLGVVVDMQAGGDGGAVLQAVTPGGPADEAGLKAGDVIVKCNGEAVAAQSPRRQGREQRGDDDEDGSPAARRLIEIAQALKDGDRVAVEYRREGQTRTSTIVARKLQRRVVVSLRERSEPPEAPEVELPMQHRFEFPELAPLALMGPWRQMELVTLNPDLASYFNTDRGILVVKAPSLSGLNLAGGDVILKIGDEAPATPGRAVRLMRAHDSDSPLTLLVLRKGKEMIIQADVFDFDAPHPAPRSAPQRVTPQAPPPKPRPKPS